MARFCGSHPRIHLCDPPKQNPHALPVVAHTTRSPCPSMNNIFSGCLCGPHASTLRDKHILSYFTQHSAARHNSCGGAIPHTNMHYNLRCFVRKDVKLLVVAYCMQEMAHAPARGRGRGRGLPPPPIPIIPPPGTSGFCILLTRNVGGLSTNPIPIRVVANLMWELRQQMNHGQSIRFNLNVGGQQITITMIS